ncbi:tyrosine-type recombinase/integrase [Achromobacter xylosoxidans]|uniref:tyrosine-type recombinase/integrase n=1 Tax=Alcaligenes xylosoxydans xylosoxydans TaxID=85698 RepID=UPI001F2F3692|nr:site-specific integrase [Achromobacter xylosoxidans]
MDHTLATAPHPSALPASARPPIDGVSETGHTNDDCGVDENPTYETVMQAYQASGKDTERFRYSQLQLDRFFKGRTLRSLRRATVQRYITLRQAAGVSPATINRELDDLSAAINWYNFLHELNLPNALVGMSLPVPEGRTRWITRGEAQRMISVAEAIAVRPHLPSFIQLALHTGCRRNELLKLRLQRVRTEEGLITLESEDTKTKKHRIIPLNAPALEALNRMAAWRAEHCPTSPWVFPSPRDHTKPLSTIQKGFRSLCAKANIDDFRIHDLRHTCASWLVMAGVPLLVVRDLLGHSSIEMTERYAHLAPNQVYDAMRRLEEAWHGCTGPIVNA